MREADVNVAAIRSAYEAYVRGDDAPLARLLAPDVYWRGRERGVLWWRRAPD